MSSANVIQNGIARLWANIDRRGDADCWTWRRSLDKNDYGQASFCNQYIRAHRLAYLLSIGDIPDGSYVLHACDNPPCCNPAHLRLGTAKDNAQDAVTRGRTLRGELHSQALLTANDVRLIRQQRLIGQTYRSLAEQFRVDVSTIEAVCSRRNWRWVA